MASSPLGRLVPVSRAVLLDNQRDDEADERQGLCEGGAHDEDGERAILDLGLTRHGARAAVGGQTDGEACTDDTEAVTDNSHNSSFSCMHVVHLTSTYIKRGCARYRTGPGGVPGDAPEAGALLLDLLRLLDVDGGEDGEHVRLDEGDEDLDGVDHEQDEREQHARQRRQDVGGGDLLQQRLDEQRDHDGERTHDDVPGEHVAEQTDGQGDRAQQGRDDLDDPDQDVEREADALRGQALEVADGPVGAHAARDEVDEGDHGEGGGGGDGAAAGLHARDDAHDVVAEDEEEQRRQEREVLLPVLADDLLAHVVLDELDAPLHDVREQAVRDERQLALEREHDHEQQDGRRAQPEAVLRHTHHEVAHEGDGMELGDEVVDLVGQLSECVQS